MHKVVLFIRRWPVETQECCGLAQVSPKSVKMAVPLVWYRNKE